MEDKKFELNEKKLMLIMAIVIGVLALIIILQSIALIIMASSKGTSAPKNQIATEATEATEAVVEEVYNKTVLVNGMLRPYKSATVEALYAPEGTEIIECYVEEGDWVEEGQVLYELSNGWDVKAPMAGKVLAKNYDKGNFVNEFGMELMVIGYTTKMRSTINVAKTDLEGVYPGMPITVTSDSFGDKVFTGEIESVSTREILGEDDIYYAVEIVVDNPGELFGGLGITVKIEREIMYE